MTCIENGQFRKEIFGQITMGAVTRMRMRGKKRRRGKEGVALSNHLGLPSAV